MGRAALKWHRRFMKLYEAVEQAAADGDEDAGVFVERIEELVNDAYERTDTGRAQEMEEE